MNAYLGFNQRFAKFKSVRLQQAVAGIAGVPTAELNLADASPTPRKKRRHGTQSG